MKCLRSISTDANYRISKLGIQLLPEQIRKYLFGAKESKDSPYLTLAIEHLKAHNLYTSVTPCTPYFDLQCPTLRGKNLKEHFDNIAQDNYGLYLDMAKTIKDWKAPPIPSSFIKKPFWTRYGFDGSKPSSVECPKENVLVFDVEVLKKLGHYPTLAVAMSDAAFYVWLSPIILSAKEKPEYLIRIGDPSVAKLIVGHFIPFDRSLIAEEYQIDGTKSRFIDTMCLHMATRGLSSNQRSLWKKLSFAMENGENIDTNDQIHMSWFKYTSPSSLKDLALFYLEEELSKDLRDIFVEGNLEDVQQNLDSLINYCAKDVIITQKIFNKVFPEFFERKIQGNMVSFGGMLEMGSSYLPVSPCWPNYIAKCEELVSSQQNMVEEKLRELVDIYIKSKEDLRSTDIYLRQLDWSTGARGALLPKWYRDILSKDKLNKKLTIKSKISPLLLRLTWKGYPLVYLGRSCGWCFRVPKNQSLNSSEYGESILESEFMHKGPTEESYLNFFRSDSSEYNFYRVPVNSRPVGSTANCGSPFAKEFINAFENGILCSEHEIAKVAIKANTQCSYWVSVRERVKSQFVVPNNHGGVILPKVAVMGTVTRRAVEATWLTASNAKAQRIGSEIKSLITAPEGYSIIGADVDSQELWIAALLGDSMFQEHGATAFGWMTLQGSKKIGTDLHSQSASILKSSRDHAKVFNYARIYGSGIAFSSNLLKKFNPALSSVEANERVIDLYRKTKGLRYKSTQYNNSSNNKSLRRKLSSPFWHGGTESFMFNKLEEIASSEDPRTPILGCQLPDSMMPIEARKRFLTSCVNWVVQSSGVDYLHLLLISMKHLCSKYDIKLRLLITIHDEIRFLVKEEDSLRACYALQISNLWTRSLFSERVGMKDLPWSVAFFSSVEVDKILRKEPNDPCVTPSNPEGYKQFGHSYTMEDLVKRGVTLGVEQKSRDHEFQVDEQIDVKQTEDKFTNLWIQIQMASSGQKVSSLIAKGR